jgi:hypothetical protein
MGVPQICEGGRRLMSIARRPPERHHIRTPSANDASKYSRAYRTYTFVASKLQEAHAACFREFILHLSSAMDANPGCVDLIVVDNTNTTVHELSPYMLAAQAFGFEAEVHRIGCDPAIAAARNLHGVPTQSVRAMAERMARERLPARWAVREVRS